MDVAHCMSRDVKICSPNDSIQQAARTLKEIDCGFLPVGENDRLIGTITDRDIAIRAVAEGKGGDTPVRDVMTRDIQYCLETDDIDDAASKMGDMQVRRLPVLDNDKRLVGVISLGDIAKSGEGFTDVALSGVSRRGGRHQQ